MALAQESQVYPVLAFLQDAAQCVSESWVTEHLCQVHQVLHGNCAVRVFPLCGQLQSVVEGFFNRVRQSDHHNLTHVTVWCHPICHPVGYGGCIPWVTRICGYDLLYLRTHHAA